MSISAVRNFLEKSGCAMGVSIVLAILFVIGFLMVSNPNQGGGDGQQLEIARVGDTPITFEQVDEITRQQTQQYFAQLESVPPELETSVMGGALRQMVDQAIRLELANRAGIEVDPDDLPELIRNQFEQSMRQQKEQLVAEGKLKAGATEKEVDDAFKTAVGATIKEQRDRMESELDGLLSTEGQRQNLLAYFSTLQLIDEYKKKISPNEDQLKASFDTLEVKRILFDGAKGDASLQAQKALDEMKGGLTFEQAIDRYSTETPTEGKKLSEMTSSLGVSILENSPEYQPLLALKAGEVSPPIPGGAGAVVYKLLERKSNVPADFDKAKARYLDGYKEQVASQRLNTEVEKLRDEGIVQWKSEGYHVLYDFATVLDTAGPTGGVEQLREIEARAAAVTSGGDPAGSRPAALVRYLVLKRLPDGDTEEAKAEMAQKRLEAIQNLLLNSEGVDLRLEMVDILLAQKDALAAQELLRAAENNNSPTDIGQRAFTDIVARYEKIKAANLGSPEDFVKIDAELERWRKDKKEYDEGQAEMKRLEEEQRKQAEAEAKAEEAAAKKEDAATSGGPSSSDLSGN